MEEAQLRQIIREELERVINIMMDAKITATAMNKGLYYGPLPLRNKPVRRQTFLHRGR